MTEVPEHLLRRSKERRAALGLGGEGEPAAPSGEGDAAPTGASAAAPVRAEAAPAAAPAPAPPAVVEPPKPPPPYVAAALTRPKVPKWALPVLAVLPLWGFVYAGALYEPSAAASDPVLQEGQGVYEEKCAGCHGGEGGGGTGRPLEGGEVIATFPDPADHVAWVTNGSPAEGTPYGDPDREGGQHISQDEWPAMPAFGPESATPLTEEEIIAVVRYEREILSGETESALAGGEGEAAPGGGSPDTPTNEAESEGGDVGGEGGSGEEDDASPGEDDREN